MPTVEEIYAELRQVFDPEIPVNIVDLGLIYEVKVEDTICKIQMTLTSQACPEAKTIPDVMKRRCNTVEGIEETEIDIVWEPQWGPQLISAEGRKILGIEDPEPGAADTPSADADKPADKPAADKPDDKPDDE